MHPHDRSVENHDPLTDPVQNLLASCSKAVGEAYFPVVVETLAAALGMRWVFLSTLHPLDNSRACTLAAWDQGLAPNFEYELAGTPCAHILSQGICTYPKGIQELFPEDDLLQEIGAHSYIGTPLRSSSGEVLGLLAAMDEKPIADPQRSEAILELFSGRAAAEIERLATASLNERLGRIVENSVSEVYIFDAQSYRFLLVNRGARDNLGYSMEELRELTPWDLKPKYNEEEFKAFVRPLKDGRVANLLFETVHRRKDGSLYDVAVQLQCFPGLDNVFYASISDITDRKQAEEARAHLAAVVASSSEAIISKTLDGRIRSWNAGAEAIYGYTAAEIVGQSVNVLVPPELHDEEAEVLARIRRGETVRNYETIRLDRHGQRIDVSVNVSPIFDAAGTIVGASSIAHDISEQKRAEARERLLMGEINHRAKNLLALVQVIARQTVASDPQAYAQRFEERILALSASHDVLVNNGWQEVPLEDLVKSQLDHFDDGMGARIRLAGPPIKVTAPAAQALGMALHELATNAAKYGALSNSTGTVDVQWQLEDQESRFTLQWTEGGGPPVEKPERTGFGSRVISRILATKVEGDVTIDWDRGGLVCRLSCPAGQVVDALPSPQLWTEPEIDPPQPVSGSQPNILIVEDEVLIAMQLSDWLSSAGFAVLGPVGSVAQAIRLLEENPCAAAVLDINLGSETSEPVAARLAQMGLPFLTVSSCNIDQRPGAYAGSPHLPKPVRPAELTFELTQLVSPPVAPSPPMTAASAAGRAG